MKRFRMPGPAMIVAVAALIAALAGSAYAGSKVGFGELSKGAKSQTAGVGPLTYVQANSVVGPTGPGGATVAAFCPAGTVPIGGGIRVLDDVNTFVNDSHPISGGYAGTVFNTATTARTFITTAVCATSRNVVGTLQTTSKGQ